MDKNLLMNIEVYFDGKEDVNGVWKSVPALKKRKITKFIGKIRDEKSINLEDFGQISAMLTDEKQKNLLFLMVCEEVKLAMVARAKM